MSGIQRRCFKKGKGVRRKNAFVLPTNGFMDPKVLSCPFDIRTVPLSFLLLIQGPADRNFESLFKRAAACPLGMLYLLSYVFLLRMQSEAIPARAVHGDFRLRKEGEFLVLHLARRKNKPGGSQLIRGCWCTQC